MLFILKADLKDLPTQSALFMEIHNIFDCYEATERVTLVNQCNILNVIIFQLKLMVTRTEHLFFRPLENVMDDPHIDSNHLTGSMDGFLCIHSGYKHKMEVTNPNKQTQDTHIY